MMAKKQAATVTDLPKLSAPAQRALSGAGISNLEQVAKMSESGLLQLHGIGKNALETLRAALTTRGLSFAMSKPERQD